MQRVSEAITKYATRDRTPTNEDNMIYYSEDYPDDYVIVADFESTISFPDVPVGAEVIRVDLELKTLALVNWSWNGTSRILTLIPGIEFSDASHAGLFPTSVGQLVSIIYKIKKTTL